MTDKQIASDRIAQLLENIKSEIAQAKEIADNAGTGFRWDYETLGLGYGMGGWYDSDPEVRRHHVDGAGWQASSHSC